MQRLLAEARTIYDTVLVDTAPLLPVADTAAIAPLLDGVILICRYKGTKRNQISAALSALHAVSVNPVASLLTMTPASGTSGYKSYSQHVEKQGNLPGPTTVESDFGRANPKIGISAPSASAAAGEARRPRPFRPQEDEPSQATQQMKPQAFQPNTNRH